MNVDEQYRTLNITELRRLLENLKSISGDTLSELLKSMEESYRHTTQCPKSVTDLLNINVSELIKWYHYINREYEGDIVYHTFHGTKGLEFGNVLIVLNNSFKGTKNYFKKFFDVYCKNTTNIDANYIEVRNLLYVAVTRAKHNLLIQVPEDMVEEYGKMVCGICGIEKLCKIVEILHVKRPQAFLFQINSINSKNELFKYFCDEITKAGYQIKYNTVDVNSITGMPVKEKECFVYGALMHCDLELEFIKDTYITTYPVNNIWERMNICDEWYYKINPKIEFDIENNSIPTIMCWKNNHYEKSEYVVWNPRMVPLVLFNDKIRKMTHREIARLKGIPDDYFLDVKNKSWLYQKLMFCSNVSVIQKILSAFNYSIGERTFESRKVEKGLEFQNIIETYLKYKQVIFLKMDEDDDIYADYRFKTDTDIVSLTIKIYANNVGIEKRVLDSCNTYFMHDYSCGEKNILVVGNIVGNEIKKEVQEKYGIVIWDVENLLWLFDEFQQLKSDFISLLSFSVGEIEPCEPKVNLFKQHLYNAYNTELQEKLRKIKPGKEDSRKYEELCVEILKYIFAEDLEFLGEQKNSNDELYRFGCCCKIKHCELKEFFDTIQKFFNTKYIIFEFKNYSSEITQKEIYTTEKYLYEKALRKVAVIISRRGADSNAKKAARGCLRENGKLIICLSDADMNNLIDIKSKSGVPGDELEAVLDNMLMDLEK